MDCIRDFLDCNKIFFEILYYVSVGGAGGIFSILQLKANKRQVELHKRQVEMNEQQMEKQNIDFQPLFKISFDLDRLNKEKKYEVKIYNEGREFAHFNNWSITKFYKLCYQLADKEYFTYYIPVSVYSDTKDTGNRTGEISKKKFANDNAEFARLYDEVKDFSKNNNLYIDEEFWLIEIKYLDKCSIQQIVYFKGSEPIDSGRYNDIMDKSRKVFEFPMQSQEWKLEKIITRIENYNSLHFDKKVNKK